MRKAKFFIALGVLLVMGATTAQAQAEKKVQFDAYGAYVIPTGDFADETMGFKAGFGFGAALGYYVTPAVVIAANFNMGMLTGRIQLGDETNDVNLMNYFATIGYDFMAMSPNMSFAAYVGGGLQVFSPSGASTGDSQSNFAANGGLKYNYWFSPSVGLLLQPAITWAFVSEEDFGYSSVITFPLAAGLSFKF